MVVQFEEFLLARHPETLVILSAARAPGKAGSERKSKDPEDVSFTRPQQGVLPAHMDFPASP
jgi:hypothetical protein